MRVQITGRHVDVPAGIHKRAEEVAARLKRYDPRLSAVDFVFAEDGREMTVEGLLHIDRAEPLVANGRGERFRAALDDVADKLARQLRRAREKAVERKGPKLSEALTEE
ncbi:MAG: ribosome-associated translation inhibitor RaiA [Gemmatimonadetes bacterium]|nr:MAG: ribosome-associated translation inhibitor RaiA [Gemmatimonadota bacterium]